jgi:hypothetical protein
MSTASIIRPPREGSILVLALTAAPSTQQSLGELEAEESGYWNFIADVDWYATFGSKGTVLADPDPAAVAGNGRTFLIPAKSVFSWVLGQDAMVFKARGSAVGTLRYYRG